LPPDSGGIRISVPIHPMSVRTLVLAISPLLFLASTGEGAVSTGNPFDGAPPDGTRPWTIHDRNRPQPKRVEPGTFSTPTQPGKPPSDAIVLFDGTEASLAKWEMESRDGAAAGPAKWTVQDGALTCTPGTGVIRTKEQFGDCQLHLEWAAPAVVKGDSQGRGNSGIFLMGICEVQVLDSYNNPTYADGSANSIYGVNPPMANVILPPGQFQSVDIVFRRPVFKDAKLIEPGRVTVFCNGVVVQDSVPIVGENYNKVGWKPRVYPNVGPLKFQDHGNPVRFRNIWYRPLPPRPIDGGADGELTAEATTAKRKEIAAGIRADAAKLKGSVPAEMLRLGESLVYEKEPATQAQFEQMAERYASALKGVSGGALEQRKGEILQVLSAFKYLARWNLVSTTFAPLTALSQIEKSQGWDQPKKK
jgi:hypothetical protein